jgi:hypothetical protein
MVALSNSTRDGSVIFAKNSDRQPNEPHIIVRVPRKKYSPGEKARCTYIEIDQAEETFEVLLLKPSWIWGCEMGANEFGLNIGNEAVFTKEKYGEPRLTGMDMVRIALERCRTSEEALDTLISLLEKYGQGGNCGYEKKFTYHNSFLIADPGSAWVLETAGDYWAAERVKDVRSISNCLTIGSKFDRSHKDLVKHALEKGWCRNKDEFNFSRCYGDNLVTRFSGALDRHRRSTEILQSEKGSITEDTMKRILRSHDEKLEKQCFKKASLKSVCMHGGFVVGHQTTGSCIATLGRKLFTYRLTGSSAPCISSFKPLWLVKGESFTFSEEDKDAAVEYWSKRERLHRLIIGNLLPDVGSYLSERDALEEEIEGMLSGIEENSSHEMLLGIMEHAAEREEKLIDSALSRAKSCNMKTRGSLYFRHYWKKQTNRLFEKGI